MIYSDQINQSTPRNDKDGNARANEVNVRMNNVIDKW